MLVEKLIKPVLKKAKDDSLPPPFGRACLHLASFQQIPLSEDVFSSVSRYTTIANRKCEETKGGNREMFKDIYQVRVKGYLDQERSSWFDGLTITHNEHGETILSGILVDQAALYGVLLKIRDLGLSLLEVTQKSSIERVQNLHRG